MFKSGEIVIHKDKKCVFVQYNLDDYAIVRDEGKYNYLEVNINDITKYSVIEREEKFRKLLDV